MKRLCLLSGVVAALLSSPSLAIGHDAERSTSATDTKHFSLRLGERVWLSTGSVQFDFAGPGGSPNVLSDLSWKKVESKIFEFQAEAVFHEKFILSTALGFGYAGGGELRDQDFQGDNRTQLFSDTSSAVEGDNLSFMNIDLGYRIGAWALRENRPRSTLDVFVGFQRFKERYIATQTVALFPPGAGSIDPGQALTEEFTWNSIRLGMRSEVEVIPDVSLRGKAVFIPWTNFQLRDVHHFRADLAQNPSFEASTKGGFGWQSELMTAYRVWQTLTLEAGYQVWYLRSGSGVITSHSLIAGPNDVPFNGAESLRHGFVLGVHYTF